MRTTPSLLATLCLTGLLLGACGGGGSDGPDCTGDGETCTDSAACCTGNCDPDMGVCAQLPGTCLPSGSECQSGPDCCSFSCVDFECSDDQCTADGADCSSDGQCCSGSCDGTCVPLNGACRTSGNPCESGGDCCSQYCVDNICDGNPSFCTQSGDVCSTDFECCGGFCLKQGDADVGTCQLAPAGGATGCLSAGEVCGGAFVPEDELPICGGECCSRACFPFGPSGILVCQPPSGCRPTGETCYEDADCCGGPGNPDNELSDVTCSKQEGNPIGRCTNGESCSPAGAICRLQDNECNANANCCAGNVLQFDTCAQDNLGIPRCLAAEIDCVDPSAYEGMPCATSADCCGLPCAPETADEFAPLVCGGEACQPMAAACTTSADCCSTLPCTIPPGETTGTCGPPGECAEYGQDCSDTVLCCNDVPCNNGTCGVIIP